MPFLSLSLSSTPAPPLIPDVVRHVGEAVAIVESDDVWEAMIGGQLLDLEGEGTALDLTQLERVHRLKTGALINASVRIGGLAAGASESCLVALEQYGAAIGLAFQIADDVLDRVGDKAKLGKRGSDADNRKLTYPRLYGIDGSRRMAAALSRRAAAGRRR